MNFDWTDEQLALRDAVVAFARGELNEGLAERDRESAFSRENWRKCAEFGLLGSAVPEAYGGSGFDALTATLMIEGLGYGCQDNGLIFALNAQMWSVQHPILAFGSEAQKQKFLPALCRGELIGAHGMTEPDSGSDAFALRTRAVKGDGGYVLNGSKTLVTSAPVADFALVLATIDPKLGHWGITAFLVEKDTPGLSFGNDMHKMGLRTAPMGEIVLQDCFVPEDNRLGEEGGGAGVFHSSMEWERSFILAGHVGAMERQLENCVRYAKERQQFGQPIGKFQSVGNRIAEMKVRLETARMALYRVAWLKSRDESAEMDAAIAKLYLSECFVKSSMDSIAIHGGYGYLSEFEIERDLRDAMGGTLYSGTSDIQRVIISRLLGL